MTTSVYTEKQILRVLKEAASGVPVAELCRKHGMSPSSFYTWRTRYGKQVSVQQKLKALDAENRRLRKLCAALQRDAQQLRKALN